MEKKKSSSIFFILHEYSSFSPSVMEPIVGNRVNKLRLEGRQKERKPVLSEVAHFRTFSQGGYKNCMSAACGLPDMWTAVMNVCVVMVPDAEQQCEGEKKKNGPDESVRCLPTKRETI